MKQAQQMQENMRKSRTSRLGRGGRAVGRGMVKVTMTAGTTSSASHRFRPCRRRQETARGPGGRAINDAVRKVEAAVQEKMSALTAVSAASRMKLPF